MIIVMVLSIESLVLCAIPYTTHCYAASAATAAATGATAASAIAAIYSDCMCSMFAPYINYIGGAAAAFSERVCTPCYMSVFVFKFCMECRVAEQQQQQQQQ